MGSTIEGQLLAIGTSADSIRFRAIDPEAGAGTWHGIEFTNRYEQTNASAVSYARIDQAVDGVTCGGQPLTLGAMDFGDLSGSDILLTEDTVIPSGSGWVLHAPLSIGVDGAGNGGGSAVGIDDSRIELIQKGILYLIAVPDSVITIQDVTSAIPGPATWYGIRLGGYWSIDSTATIQNARAALAMDGAGTIPSLSQLVTMAPPEDNFTSLSFLRDQTLSSAWTVPDSMAIGFNAGGDLDSTGLDSTRVELTLGTGGSLSLGAGSSLRSDDPDGASPADWYGVVVSDYATQVTVDTLAVIRDARAAIAVDGDLPSEEDLAEIKTLSDGSNTTDVSLLRDYALTDNLTIPDDLVLGFSAEGDHGSLSDSVDTNRVELLTGAHTLTLGNGCVLRSDDPDPSPGQWYGIRTPSESYISLPSSGTKPKIMHARAAIAYEDETVSAWPDFAVFDDLDFQDNVSWVGFDRDRVVATAVTIPAGFVLGFNTTQAVPCSVSVSDKCELVVADSTKLIAIGTEQEPVELVSTVPDSLFQQGDEWYGIRLQASGLASGGDGYGFLGCVPEPSCYVCSDCEAKKSEFKDVVISGATRGLSIEGNMAPEIGTVTFQDIAEDRDIYLTRDVVIPPDFSWNLVAPTHVVAADADSVIDYSYGIASKIDLLVEGLLNTDSANPDSDRVYFEPEVPDNNSADEWGGVQITWARNGDSIRGADFSYAENPLYVWGSDSLTTISNSKFHHFADTGLWMRESFNEGAVVDSNTVYRGDELDRTLGRIGVLLDRTDELEFADNTVQMEANQDGAPDISDSRAVEVAFSSSMCSQSGPARTLSVTDNDLTGPGASYTSTAPVSGIYSSFACGGGGRTVEYAHNRIAGFNGAGLDFSQSFDMDVSCNRVDLNRKAVQFSRSSNTGSSVRILTNYLEADESHGIVVVRTTNAKMIKLGPTSSQGENELRTVAGIHAVDEDEPGNSHVPLDVTYNRWFRDGSQEADSNAVAADSLVWTSLTPTASNLPYYVISPVLDDEGSACWPDSSGTVARKKLVQAAVEPAGRGGPQDGPGATGVEEALPLVTSVGLPFPNPARGPISINLAISADHQGGYRAEVFNIAGRSVALLVDRRLSPGRYRLEWTGRDRRGSRVAPGIYFLRVTGPRIRTNAKIVMVR